MDSEAYVTLEVLLRLRIGTVLLLPILQLTPPGAYFWGLPGALEEAVRGTLKFQSPLAKSTFANPQHFSLHFFNDEMK